uniref:Anthocyanin 5-aromatic acyltransferase n=2 Tax=Cajanus cajan TaxID=3821 RepID=A0A151RVV0_CAJCA|nr:Anthocyanin 5-aromatic acyltransferase [Cajanus cajan]
MTQPSAAPFKVIQVCSVAPLEAPKTNPSTTVAPTSLTLTFFDLLWLRFPAAQCLFFYSFPHPTSSFHNSLLPSLKHSLSLTLQHFLPFAGTITWPHNSPSPIISYVPGNTVPLTIAQSNADFDTLSSNLCEAPERHRFVPQLTTSHEQASVLALQVTVFPNTGFCIGITTHHAAFDGKSSIMFIKSWAYICSNLQHPTPSPTLSLPQHLTPFFDRSVIRDPSGLSEAYVATWMHHGGPNNRSLKVWESIITTSNDGVKGLFELTPSQILKLKQHAQCKMKVGVQLSTFSVTSAYVLTCLLRAKQPAEDNVSFVFAADCRSRLDPPIPGTYFGNCVASKRVRAVTKKLVGNDGFVSALEGIGEVLNSVKDGGVLSGAECWVSEMHEKVDGRMFPCAGSPRFEVYSTDFGWGRPKKVDITSTDTTGAFSFSQSRDDSGGVEIGLMLDKREMEDFTTFFVQGLESL